MAEDNVTERTALVSKTDGQNEQVYINLGYGEIIYFYVQIKELLDIVQDSIMSDLKYYPLRGMNIVSE